MNFSDEIFDVTDRARARIVEVLTARGTNYHLTDLTNKVDSLVLFSLPNTTKFTKPDLHEQCGIVAINIDTDERLTFEAITLESNTDEVFQYNELEVTTICQIADLVNILESGN